MLVHNDHHVGCQKLKDRWGDDTYQVISHVNEDVPVYVIKNKWGRRQTLHRNHLFLVSQAVSIYVYHDASRNPSQEANEECQPLMELEPDVDAQDTSRWRFLESMSNAVGTVKAAIARRQPHE